MSRASFQIVAKPAGPACDLACTYCFYRHKPVTGRMSVKVLESFIRQRIETESGREVDFIWQGGEPTLLGVEFFEQVVALQRKYAGGKRIHNALQTHGGLLDDTWGEFLAREDFLVGLSIDGPAKLHNARRIDKQGQPTFDTTMHGLDILKRHGVRFNTLTVVGSHNAHAPLAVYRFLKSIDSEVMQFIPLVERDTTGQPTPESVSGAAFGEFLVQIFDEWVRHDVGRHFVQHFDAALSIWLGRGSPLCLFAPECGRVPALEANGDVFACDHYVSPDYKLGNLMTTPLAELVDSPAQQAFGAAKAQLPQQCQRCNVRFACHGECPKNRFTISEDDEPGLNALCAGYQRFFSHIDLPMQAMAKLLQEGHTPADIMQILGPPNRSAVSICKIPY